MKDAEDEAFDDLARRQGMWGGGYQAKKAMAAAKLQEPVARVMGTYGGRFVVAPLNPAVVLPVGMALYAEIQHTATWVGLTDEEIKHIEETTTCLKNESWLRNLTRNLEAKLRSKNT